MTTSYISEKVDKFLEVSTNIVYPEQISYDSILLLFEKTR